MQKNKREYTVPEILVEEQCFMETLFCGSNGDENYPGLRSIDQKPEVDNFENIY